MFALENGQMVKNGHLWNIVWWEKRWENKAPHLLKSDTISALHYHRLFGGTSLVDHL